MMRRREDLRVLTAHYGPLMPVAQHHLRRVSDAELAELIESMGYVRPDVAFTWTEYVAECARRQGWVEPPDCERCNGLGHRAPDALGGCPSCGGTGKQRMVALGGIDVPTLRADLQVAERVGAQARLGDSYMMIVVRQLLAALEGDTDE